MVHRVKPFYIFLDCIVNCTESPFQHIPIRANLAKEHYKITFDDKTVIKEIDEYEKFDYDIFVSQSNHADPLVNEMWPYLDYCGKLEEDTKRSKV